MVHALSRSAAPATSAATVTILVVDDEPGIRLPLEAALTEEGFRVVTARDGGEALRAASAAPPAVVLTDLMMPGLDGYALIDRLRTAPLPIRGIIAMSAGSSAQPHGADLFLAKPFALEQVIASIDTLLAAENADGSGAR